MNPNELEQVLSNIHTQLGKTLLEKIMSGDATSGDLNVARQFLKDNGIDMVAKRDKNLKKLADILPFQDPEEPIAKSGT